jgi:hypothetical protein
MLHKLGAIGIAGAIMASLAVPAFACEGSRCLFRGGSEVSNRASIYTESYATAMSGGNSISTETEVERAALVEVSGNTGSSTIETGNATASTSTEVNANVNRCACPTNGTTELSVLGCMSCRNEERNYADTYDYSDALAATGDNSISDEKEVERALGVRICDGGSGTRTIRSGAASAATRTIVNTNVRGL